jgi:hypothetical protein
MIETILTFLDNNHEFFVWAMVTILTLTFVAIGYIWYLFLTRRIDVIEIYYGEDE